MDGTLEAAVAAHRAGDFDGAERGYLALPADARALHNLGGLYADTGRLSEAEHVLRAALAITADPRTEHSLGMVLLAQGRYAEGWMLYEARRRVPNSTTINPPDIWPNLPPEWDGGQFRGRLLVIGEQGFGDQIMFARFVPMLADRGIEAVTIMDQPLSRIFPWSQRGRRSLPGDLGAWVLLGSLPRLLGTTLANIPSPAAIPVDLRSGGGIGVVSRGRAAYIHDASRSLRGDDADKLAALGRDLSPEATGATDFYDTAQIIAGLDLIITVDTANAHLAASMGKPTWVLLANHGTDWRWLHDRDDSPWYPSVRLFRQRRGEPWSSVIGHVLQAL